MGTTRGFVQNGVEDRGFDPEFFCLFVQKFVCNTHEYVIFVYAGIDFEYTYCFDLLKIINSVQLRVVTTMKVKKMQRENLSSRLERDSSVNENS
jgi:hypothetical protein